MSTGALGYVVKSDAALELLVAVRSVLRDKQFFSSSLSGPNGSHNGSHNGDEHTGTHASKENGAPLRPHGVKNVGRHDVVFYSDDRQLLNDVSRFIGAALNVGNAAIVIATDSHRDSLVRELEDLGVNIGEAIEQGRYIAMDAADTISMFMVSDVLQADPFVETFGKLILKAANAATGKHPRVAIFGECPDLLWKQGKPDAAILDENLGNQLLERYDVDILCGYSLDNVQSVDDEDIYQQICAEHSCVRRP